MAAVLLDTNIYSYIVNKHQIARLYDKHLAGQQQTLCFVVVGELLEGAARRKWGPVKVAQMESDIRTLTVIPYDLQVCRAWATLWEAKNADGSARTVSDNDRWIAACAIRHNIPLISHNRKDFEGLPGLRLVCEAPSL